MGVEELGKRDRMKQRVPKMNQQRKKEGRVVEEGKQREGKQDPSFERGDLHVTNAIKRVKSEYSDVSEEREGTGSEDKPESRSK